MDRGALTVLTVVGTRPEVIKMAPVLHELARHRGVRPVLCVTGQHREMVEDALKLFGLTEDHNLAVMERDQALGPLTSRLVERLDAIVQRVQPRWVIAQGDTTSVMAAAMVGFYRNVSFAHVEAGLRTGDLRQPFPEEFNRRVASLAAQLHFAPTEHASAALQREGVPPSRIHVTGNTGIDALLQMASRPHVPAHALLRDVPPEARVVLVTAHRRESFGHPLVEICEAVAELARAFAGDRVHFVYPVHPHPRVGPTVDRKLGTVPHVTLLPPLGYLDLIHVLRRSVLVLTDSGGLQEEAPALGVPVLVLRERTERPEGLEWGCARLVGARRDVIVAQASLLLRDPVARQAMVARGHPYGDGHAAERIVNVLLGKRPR
jgi:UDP-N-acetylglucosamine 2-epimerase (non-hydrolysing)